VTARHRHAYLLAACAALLLVVGVSAAAGASPTPAKPTKTISLAAATTVWTYTGLDLRAGQAVKITAAGSISYGSWNSDCGGPISPSGCKAEAICQFPGACGGIVGRLGSGAPFVVGKYKVVKGPGKVFLIVNDAKGAYGDNSGAFSVTLKTITSADVKFTREKFTDSYIDLTYHGTGWDASGGPIKLSFSGNAAGSLPAQETFTGSLKIRYWPHRPSVQNNKVVGEPDCWGMLAARQGSSWAGDKVTTKREGIVLFSLEPRIKAHQYYCRGEEKTLLEASTHPIITYTGDQVSLYQGAGLPIRTLVHAPDKPGDSLICFHVQDRGFSVRVFVNPTTHVLSTTVSNGSCG
jgi:PA-IL-like protein